MAVTVIQDVGGWRVRWRVTCCRVLFQLLEYVGKGKSIMDVGLAQARQPLCTRSHYFEVEIVDPGEKCYIALGLARRVSNEHGIVCTCSYVHGVGETLGCVST